jgi:ATP-dependent DNA helicase RecG
VPLELSTPVKFIKRIGDRVAANLATRGIVTVEDLLYHLPFRYEDRLHPRPLSTYRPGDMASLIGEVRGTVLLRARSGPIFEMTVGIHPPTSPLPSSNLYPQQTPELPHGLGFQPPVLETVKCIWFHGTYLKDKFRPGQTIALYGKLEGSRSGNALNAPPGSTKFKLIQPTFEILPDHNATGEDAEFTMLEMGRIVPIYESLGGTTPWGAKLTSRWLRRVLWTIFKDLTENPATTAGAPVGVPDERSVLGGVTRLASETWVSRGLSATDDTLPTALRTRLDLPTRMAALQAIHFPPADTSLHDLTTARTPAHRRLIFEEFFYLELGLQLKRKRLRARAGTAFLTNDNVRTALKQALPFKPTAAQKRVLGEIVADMQRPQPMRRLLQGDVGSGKTIVAFQAALVAIENGTQVALMAPTEILATQHYLNARKLLGDKISPTTGQRYRIALLTGSLDDATKRTTRARLARGDLDLAIGTHALVSASTDFANLGLVIVDEQHRFGVQQRFQLIRKDAKSGVPSGRSSPAGVAEPDVLVMTATPIPRTLALTVYGDLEASILDELPPGRTPIITRRMAEDRAAEVWDFLRKQVTAGRQAYIVYPIIEGTPDDQPELDFPAEKPEGEGGFSPLSKTSKTRGFSPGLTATKPKRKPTRQPLRSATEMHDHLANGPLAGLRLGLLHGRMSADDKDVTMARFKRGELDVLIATTVIEVGVDVPNATLMVIEHAERFGLAQLHQLRGRVGRGAQKSFCVLVTGSTITPEAEQRLDAMVQHSDGFALAEIDLAQRGPGEFFGTRQAGLPDLRVASLTRDRDILELATAEAARFTETPDPAIPRPELDAVWSRLKQQWQRRYGLLEA